jgi:hypothetical protein
MKGRTQAALIALSIFFFFLPNLCHFFSFIYYKKNLKNHKIYFNKILVFLCELRNHFISHHFLSNIGLLFSVDDEKNVYKKIVVIHYVLVCFYNSSPRSQISKKEY